MSLRGSWVDTGREVGYRVSSLLMPHQLEAKRKMHNGCILKGATGIGKTMTALAYYNDVEVTERLIIITTAQKRDSGDWQAEARYLALFPEVDSWQNLAKYADVKDAFFIFDEQRVVGSGPWVKSFLKICRNNQWIMLTATPGDSWLDYIPIFISNGFYKNMLSSTAMCDTRKSRCIFGSRLCGGAWQAFLWRCRLRSIL
jgi:hypothetical protein